MKFERFSELLKKMESCKSCTNLSCKDKSLINIYQDYDFCTNIPSIWTDWFNRLDSPVMIIGQDWGPYSDMQKLNSLLDKDKKNWQELIETENSNTKRLLNYYIQESSNHEYNLDSLFITNAIMCARQGNNYRSSNINLKSSTLNCRKYLAEQIDIVKPKVILTLGYYPLLSLSNIFHFKINNTLKETINNYPEIKVDDYIIIPLFHPVAQVKKEEQMQQYKRIWKYLPNNSSVNIRK